MMRSLSQAQLARIPGCKEADTDCAIEFLRNVSASEAWAILGLDPADGDVLIAGGSGRLALTADKIEFVPSPGLVSMAAGVASAVLTAAHRAITGEPVLAPAPVIRQRLAACAECMHYLAEHKRCGVCNCFTEAKVRLAASACPLSHWD
jgi:hypothetical protein